MISIAAVAAALLVPVGLRAAEPPEELRARFLNEYRPAAEQLRAAYSNFEIKFRNFSVVSGGKKHSSPIRGIIGPSGWKLTRIDPKKSDAAVQVNARNGEYEFDAGKHGDGYVLASMKSSEGEGGASIFCPFIYDVVGGRAYLRYAEDPTCTPISLSDAVFRGTPCKEFRITITGQDPRTGKATSSERVFFFDHNGQWVCLGTRAPNSDKGYVEDRYVYSRVDGFPVPALAGTSRWLVGLDGAARCLLGIDVDEFQGRKTAAPESEFRLTSIGLSEPANPRKATSWWNWYLIAAVALLAIALSIWYGRRRVGKVAIP